ncbi:right-handed parallel beta-helix repeat-containing protein [Dictyobacter formicarum]|uniref:Right handed beta helix domain-containing protein n=1 Tax=Dictyobacter formicarum TaxID=2778368 RepID=A0ABQ3V938_9CHLR|nr:right-handed parallel beta-helix repeat-containing protein [Dictyobacter formicarum]GHO82251.1 hypothetical protein KSZ_02570 [Dictyobacter formicarum]
MRLGIDFGTCFSSAAFLDGESITLIKDPTSLGYSVPSSVFLTPQGQMLVGKAANNQRLRDPLRYRREIKRDLGNARPVLLGEQAWLPDQLVMHILRKIKQDADAFMTKSPFTGAVITIPATYQQHKRDLMLQAATEAGFVEQEITLLEEPVAAGLYYTRLNQVKNGDILLVYDLGGGTFDTALMQKAGESFTYLATPSGLPRCGGADFDRAIYQDLVNKHPELRSALQGASRPALMARATLGEQCIDLKHQLSESEVAEISFVVPGTGDFIDYRLTRTEFNQMIATAVQETMTCCQQMLQQANIKPEQINHILLVGGSCRIPYVQQMLQKGFPCPIVAHDLELVVCMGAALYTPQKNYEVSPAADRSGYTSINTALHKAKPKTRILVHPGTYQEHLILEKDIEIIGIGSREEIIIESIGEPCITMWTENALIRGITLQRLEDENISWSDEDSDEHASAVYIPQGNLCLEDCDITSGSGVSIEMTGRGTSAELHSCLIHDSASTGILIHGGAKGLIEDSDIFDNLAEGIAVVNGESTPVLKSCQIHNNNDNGIYIEDVAQGLIEDCHIYANNRASIHITGSNATPTIRRCKIHDSNKEGIRVDDEAVGTIEDCDIFQNADAAILIADAGTHPRIIHCPIHNNTGVGVKVRDGAQGTIQECDIFGNEKAGISIADEESNPTILQCKIHDGNGAGIKVKQGAQGTIQECNIFGNEGAGISITDEESNPTILQCKIHDGKDAGIEIGQGARGQIEGCNISGNYTEGIIIVGEESYPIIKTCYIHDNHDDGIYLSNNAGGLIKGCDIYDNTEYGVHIREYGTEPTFDHCQMYNNGDDDLFVGVGADPTILTCYIKNDSSKEDYPSVRQTLRRLR